jgi:protein kinase A
MAPEIFTNKGYCHAVDWYALGILIYELMVGQVPFMALNPMDVF